MVGYLELIGAAVAYAVGIVAQTVAARRTERKDQLDPGLMGRLATDRMYLFGFLAQVVGFVLAFLARADLPLFLVQAGASSAVGIAAVLGAVVLGWRIRGAELAALGLLAAGLLLLVGAALPSPSQDIGLGLGLLLLATLGVAVGLAVLATRLTGPRGAVALGVLAGLAFAVLAIASRPLAAGPLLELPTRPLFWLMVGAAVVGQWLLATALQRGSTMATMASMDATSVVTASVVGLLALGDQIGAGQQAWVAIGLALVVGGVVTMAAVVKPQVTARASTRAEPGTEPEPAAAAAKAVRP